MYFDTVDDTAYIYDGTDWLDMGVQGGSGATNLGATYQATTVTVTSDTGDDVIVAAADTDSAGVMSDAMFDKLDGIEAGADVTDAANVDAAGALMESEVDTDIKTLLLPASTTISAFGATLVDDAAATNARTTLGLIIGTDVLAPGGNGSALTGLTQSQIASLTSDLALKAPLASPTFTGTVTVPTPSGATDATTKVYVDNLVQGLSWKQSVRIATTGTGTLATAYENGDTVDGVVLATGDRILLKDQGTGAENGIYIVAASGAPTRALDTNTSAEIDSMTVYVESGTANADTVWTLTTDNPTLDTTALVYAQVNGGALPSASTTVQGKVELATDAETNTGTDTSRAMTPSNLEAWTGSAQVTTVGTLASGDATGVVSAASATAQGKVELATDAETNTGTDTARAVTPANIEAWTGSAQLTTTGTLASGNADAIVSAASTTLAGKAELATAAESEARTDTTRAVTPVSLANFPVKKIFLIGDNAATQIDVTHSLGTKDVITGVRQASDDVEVECDVTNLSTSVVRLNFAVAPATDSLRVVVMG